MILYSIVFDISLSKAFSRFICTAANGRVSFFLTAEQYSIIYTHTQTNTYISHLYLSVDGHLSFFHTLVLINGAAMNIRVHVLLFYIFS